MSPYFTVHTIDKVTVVELRLSSLMDPLILQEIGDELCRLIDEEDRRIIVLDFEQVEYISSQTIGILMAMHKKLSKLPHSQFFLCGVGPKLMELLKITQLDRVLKIKPSQKEVMKLFV